MSGADLGRGGAAVGVLTRLEAWEADLVLNLRLWCAGPEGQSRVWGAYRRALPGAAARAECATFEQLIRTLTTRAYRPLVRHEPCCACLGADEAVVANLVRMAADGQLSDAALVATLMVGPGMAEHVALMAGQVGSCLRQIHRGAPEPTQPDVTQPDLTQNAAPHRRRLH